MEWKAQGWFGDSVNFGRGQALSILLHSYPQLVVFLSTDLQFLDYRIATTAPDSISSDAANKGRRLGVGLHGGKRTL